MGKFAIECPICGNMINVRTDKLAARQCSHCGNQIAFDQSEQEANAINEIQKGILAISSKEEPFDVFICYKETDENGRRTPDSVLANDLYHQLTQEGFKVFFARITLEDKLGQEYEPYIFAALNSSKVMVVLGTKPEYYKAVWVKNEWSRYLALISQGEKKMLIPAYKDMDPYDLPEEFSHLQAQDMSKLGFMQDLIRGIKKILGTDQPKTTAKETVVTQSSGNNNSALIKRQAEIDRLKEEEPLEAERLEAARQRKVKKWKMITAIVAAVTVAIIVVYMVVTKVVIPNNNYNNAVALMNSGKYREAYDQLKSLNGYKDSENIMSSILEEHTESVDIGDTVSFGNYNGNTEWIVLAKEDGKILVISKYALEDRPYNTEYTSITWEKCTLRSWLNGTYLSSAFNSDEQARIIDTSIENKDNAKYDTEGGNNTTDKVFLLSIDEVNKYFTSDSAREATLADGTSVWWWLRSPGDYSEYAVVVYRDGSVSENGSYVDNGDGAVRPALWIDIINR